MAIPNNIDDEWSNFLTNNYNNDDDDDESSSHDDNSNNLFSSVNTNNEENTIKPPEPTDIYISTKSKIAYLTNPAIC